MAARQLEDRPIDLDEKLVMSLEMSIRNVLGQFFGLVPEFGLPQRGRGIEQTSDLSGVVSIFQHNVQGILSLGFPRGLVFSLMKDIYRKEFVSVDQSIIDGVGEITNSVYGQIKKDMNERGYDLQMAIPSVIVGRGHSVMAYTNKPTLLLPVSTKLGEFHAAIILEQSRAAKITG